MHNLNKTGKKKDKVAITCHVMRSVPDLQDDVTSEASEKTESEDYESESEIVLAQVDDDSEDDPRSDTETVEHFVTQTRSGRRVGSWKNILKA